MSETGNHLEFVMIWGRNCAYSSTYRGIYYCGRCYASSFCYSNYLMVWNHLIFLYLILILELKWLLSCHRVIFLTVPEKAQPI